MQVSLLSKRIKKQPSKRRSAVRAAAAPAAPVSSWPFKREAPHDGWASILATINTTTPAAYYDGIVWVQREVLGESATATHFDNLTFKPRANRRFGKQAPRRYPVYDERQPDVDGVVIPGRAAGACLRGPHSWIGMPAPYAYSAFGANFARPLMNPSFINLRAGEFRGQLCTDNPPQVPACETVERALRELAESGAGRGILQLPCGFGKTVCAIWLMIRLGLRCIIVIHNETLLHGFYMNLLEFAPHLRIAFIGSRPGFGKGSRVCEVIGADVILASKSLITNRLDINADGPHVEPAPGSPEAIAIEERWLAIENGRTRMPRTKAGEPTPRPGWPGYRLKKGDTIPFSLLRSCGMAVFDEAHRVASEGTATLAMIMPCKYVLNLTATPFRGDGLDAQLQWITGPILYKAVRSMERVQVRGIKYSSDTHFHMELPDKTPRTAHMIKKICMDMERNGDIVADVLDDHTPDDQLDPATGLLISNPDHLPHQVLIFTERGLHCELLKAALDAELTNRGLSLTSRPRRMVGEDLPNEHPALVPTVAVLRGAVPPADRPLTYRSPIIVTTYALSGDGLNIRTASSLKLTTPTGSKKHDQRLGRVFRPCPHKQIPKVTHWLDQFSDFQGMAARCMDYCEDQEGWEVETTEEPNPRRAVGLMAHADVARAMRNLRAQADEDRS